MASRTPKKSPENSETEEFDEEIERAKNIETAKDIDEAKLLEYIARVQPLREKIARECPDD